MIKLITRLQASLLISCFLAVILTGCTPGQYTPGITAYHNETFGFSLSIPDTLAEHLKIEEDAEHSVVHFIYVATTDDSIPVEGYFFQIFVKPVSTDPQSDELLFLGKNESHSFYFWLPDELENMIFEQAYHQYESIISEIPDSFTLDAIVD